MKIRSGFVSNSSSSSFVVGYRGDREDVIKSAGILSSLMRNVLNKIDALSVDVGWHSSSEALFKAWLVSVYGEDYDKELEEEEVWLLKQVHSAFPDEGWNITWGYASYNDGDEVEMMIGNGNVCVTSDFFKMETFS